MIRFNHELFNHLSRFGDTFKNITLQTFSPGELLIRQIQTIRHIYIIKSGLAKCYLVEDNGKCFVQEFFGEGEICGEIEALKDTLSFCYVEAITELVAFKLQVEHFQHLLERDRMFNRLILRALASKINYKAIRHAHNQSHSAEENLLRLQRDFPGLVEKIPKRDIANYLGIELRSLNRILLNQ